MIDLQKRHELTKLLIECAKERMKGCNHLDVGNYVHDNLIKILNLQFIDPWKHSKPYPTKNDLRILAIKYKDALINSNVNKDRAELLYHGVSDFINTMLGDIE